MPLCRTGPRLCQPTLEPDRSCLVQGTDTDCSGGTSLEDRDMVPDNANCSAKSDCSLSDNAAQRSGGSHSSTSHITYPRERYQDQELFMLKSWRSKTNESYDSLFGKWHRWCCARPVRELTLSKNQYRSVNSYRSVISSVHERVDGYTVGKINERCL
jgi:hypothetical protein